jgi:bifunctional non-homologous end joining protein LigD
LPICDRSALARLLSDAEAGIVLSEHMDGNGPAMFEHVRRLGLEGVVSKRRDRPYRSGRSPDWVKIKNLDVPAVTGCWSSRPATGPNGRDLAKKRH